MISSKAIQQCSDQPGNGGGDDESNDDADERSNGAESNDVEKFADRGSSETTCEPRRSHGRLRSREIDAVDVGLLRAARSLWRPPTLCSAGISWSRSTPTNGNESHERKHGHDGDADGDFGE